MLGGVNNDRQWRGWHILVVGKNGNRENGNGKNGNGNNGNGKNGKGNNGNMLNMEEMANISIESCEAELTA